MNERLLEFLKGEYFDIHGRMIEDIIDWEDDRLESVHDYIQWVFPLKEESMFNRDAPVLDKQTLQAIKESPTCIKNIQHMFYVMEDFYKLYDTNNKEKWWITPNNHNFLRITRILKCLNLVGLHDDMFFMFNEQLQPLRAYEKNVDIIGDSYWYWMDATGVWNQ